MASVSIAKHWVHPDLGEVEVTGPGHFPDTVMVVTAMGEDIECPISELISEDESNKLLDRLLSSIPASKG